MRIARTLFLCVITLSVLSCSMSAQSDKTTSREAVKDEVIVMDKTAFLAKVFDYEKNPETWLYKGEKPCIIDFYADWCAPCRLVAPILRDLAVQYKNDIIVYKVDVDKEKELAAAFGIQGIPAILFVPQKGTPQMAQGALPKAEFVKQIDGFLLGKN